jgi:hypothetical protein
MVVGEEEPPGPIEGGAYALSRFFRRDFWNSFSLSQRGMAMEKEVNPRGAKAR